MLFVVNPRYDYSTIICTSNEQETSFLRLRNLLKRVLPEASTECRNERNIFSEHINDLFCERHTILANVKRYRNWLEKWVHTRFVPELQCTLAFARFANIFQPFANILSLEMCAVTARLNFPFSSDHIRLSLKFFGKRALAHTQYTFTCCGGSRIDERILRTAAFYVFPTQPPTFPPNHLRPIVSTVAHIRQIDAMTRLPRDFEP